MKLWNTKVYIRFGNIPFREESGKYNDNGGLVGFYSGTSVYNCRVKKGKYYLQVKFPFDINYINNIRKFIYDTNPFSSKRIPVYLVTGDEVGVSDDGEPLIRNIKILKNITNEIVKESYNN